MKDIKPFKIADEKSNKKRYGVDDEIHRIIIDHVQQSTRDDNNLEKHLGCFSNWQLVDFLTYVHGRKAEKRKVGRYLFSRIEVGDKVFLWGDNLNNVMRTVIAKTLLQITLDNWKKARYDYVDWYTTLHYDELVTIYCKNSKIPIVNAAPDMQNLLSSMPKSDRCDIAYFRISIENVLKKANGEEQDEW